MRVDWDGDGLFANAESDVTHRVVSNVKCKRGRSFEDQIYGRSEAGVLIASVRNYDGLFDDFDINSALVDKIIPGRLVEFAARKEGDPDWITLWTGLLDQAEPKERQSGRDLFKLKALGAISLLTQVKASTAVYNDVSTDDSITHIWDAAGVPARFRGTVNGDREMAVWFVTEGESAIRAVRAVEATELGFYLEARDGRMGMEAENARQTNAGIQFILSRDGVESGRVGCRVLKPRVPRRDISNIVTVPVRQFTNEAQAVLWSLGTTPEIAAGRKIVLVATYPNPNTGAGAVAADWTPLVANTDYLANDNAQGTGTDRTAALTVTVTEGANALRIEIENTHTGAVHLTRLQARGQALVEGQAVGVESRDQASVDLYDPRPYQAPPQWISDIQDAESYGGFLVSLLKDPHTRARAQFETAIYPAAAFTADLSQRVRLQRRGIQEEMFIESVEYDWIRGGRMPVELMLSPAEAYADVIVLDAGPGLGTGRLAR